MACPFAQFDGERFYDSEYVRKYRSTLLDYVYSGKRGFGIHFTGTTSNVNVGFQDGNRVLVTYSIGGIHVETTISISEDGHVAQSAVLKSTSIWPAKVDYTLALNISVNRASYGQLTEGGPIPIPPSRNDFRLFDNDRVWAVTNPNLDAMIQGTLFYDGVPVRLGPGMNYMQGVSLERPVDAAFRGTFSLPPNETRTLTLISHLRPDTTLAVVDSSPKNFPSKQAETWNIGNDAKRLIIKGNLAYILGNCTVPVSNEYTCFITDHVALPLGWNRDN